MTVINKLQRVIYKMYGQCCRIDPVQKDPVYFSPDSLMSPICNGIGHSHITYKTSKFSRRS